MRSMLLQVEAVGSPGDGVNLIEGCGLNPNGGMAEAPVVKASISLHEQ